jgi:uncharacterized protein (TIGR02246 family)
MVRKTTVVLCGLGILLLGAGWMTAEDKAKTPDIPKDPKRAADVETIRKLGQDYIKAFEKGDAKAMAAFWTDAGEFTSEEGNVIRGRAAIEKLYADLFAKKEVRKVDMHIDALRFPSNDTALLDATLRRTNAEGETISSSWIHSLLVREGGQWKVAVVREWERDVSQDVSLKDLDWAVGTWVAANKDKEVMLTYAWDENKAFLQGKFTVKDGGKVTESGQQFVGKDNSQGVIRSWVFQSDGGFGGGTWTRDGKQWTVESAGVLPDGSEMTATNIYTRVDADTVTWRSINRKIDGQALPDTEPIKVTRQKK